MAETEIVTEAYAVEHWECPVRRHISNELGVIQDRDSAIYNHSMCCASACPVWRWSRDHSTPNERRKGYCGLGGQPARAAP